MVQLSSVGKPGTGATALEVEALVLARLLSSASSITVCDLTQPPGYPGIGPRGAMALGAALQQNQSLRRLLLCGNHLGDAFTAVIDGV
eukprot:6222448-Prymnesium_polylepis.1